MYPADDELSRRFSELDAKYAAATRWGDPTYDADCLRVWNKNADFMADPRFAAAYRAGMGSDHRLDRHAPDTIDIHIEWRIHVCCWAAWHANRLEGDFVECGTNTGIMSLAICHYIDFNSTGKRFFLFDTYRGIPEDQIGSQEGHAREQNLAYRDCFETAQRNFRPFPNAILVRGKVPQTLPTQPIDKVCYLMLDMNIVHPEREALGYFWEKLVPGGIVLFDDYGWLGYDAQKNAHDAFAAAHGVKILNLPTGQGMLIKP
jgi:SAM-dependent methyltransferase